MWRELKEVLRAIVQDRPKVPSPDYLALQLSHANLRNSIDRAGKAARESAQASRQALRETDGIGQMVKAFQHAGEGRPATRTRSKKKGKKK